MSDTQQFRQLHRQGQCLYIGNVWDVPSAKMFEKMGYQALGTSSAAIADTLGYADGEQMDFAALLNIVKSIVSVTSVPLTVDIEGGYSRDKEVLVQHIIQLAEIGVVGINLEDSVVCDNHRSIVDETHFSESLQFIKHHLRNSNIDIFINARTDAFIMGLDKPLATSLNRAVLYEAAGADGIFIPCVVAEGDIQELVESVSIPVNIMAMPQLPNFSKIEDLGVRRLSSGPFIYHKIKQELEHCLQHIERDQSFELVF